MRETRTAAESALEVTRERMDQYGHPRVVYRRTAALWSGYLGQEIEVKDVALMMVLFKMGRERTREGRDNLVDMHGYLLVYERILEVE